MTKFSFCILRYYEKRLHLLNFRKIKLMEIYMFECFLFPPKLDNIYLSTKPILMKFKLNNF